MLQNLVLKAAVSYVPNLIRYLGTTAGTAIATNGLADANTSQAVSGAVVVLLTFAWSVAEKKGLVKQLIG